MIQLDDVRGAQAIATSVDWRRALYDLLGFWVPENRCFSSGEIATVLRTWRMDELKFAVTGLGRYLREEYEADRLPHYATGRPVQVERWTAGGTMVFVYGPTQEDAEDHDFECFVPKPPAQGVSQPNASVPSTTTSVAVPSVPAPVSTVVDPKVEITGKDPDLAEMLYAQVYREGRVTVPRRAFERAVQLGHAAMASGMKVCVEHSPDGLKTTIFLNPDPGTETHTISTQGRVEYLPPANISLSKGARCPLVVYHDCVVINYR